jgi:hypothetical protein
VQLQPLVDALRSDLLKHSVLHADEIPVGMLKPGNGKTYRAYPWSYCTTTYIQTNALVFDSADSRAGQHARDFLGLPGKGGGNGSLLCDDFSGYKACFDMRLTEAGCLAHARRFHECGSIIKAPSTTARCPRSRPAGSTNYCRIVGNPCSRLPDPVGRRQDGITARLRNSEGSTPSAIVCSVFPL